MAQFPSVASRHGFALMRFSQRIGRPNIYQGSVCALSTSRATSTEGKVKVLYDGGCSLCAQEMKVVKYLNKDKNIVELVDVTQPGYDPSQYNNITFKQAMEEFHVIDAENKVHKRVPAFHTMYSSLGYSWTTTYTRWPILAPLFDRAYGWFARNRLRWTKREHVMGNHPNVKDTASSKTT